MFDLTVVVPTYNRRFLLQEAIESLRAQTYPADRYEILIVSDGSTDGTDELYAQPLEEPHTRLIRQVKQGFGLSAARNLGAREAQAKLVLFLDDDMTADPGMVEAHVYAHRNLDDMVAVRGNVTLAPAVPDAPFCQIVLGDVCRLYDECPDDAGFVGFEMALSWQTSFKRESLLRLGGYDESFRAYGWEDIEFSYRMTQQGLRFYYEPRAISYHNDQRQTLRAHGERVRNSSQMALKLFDKYPELSDHFAMYHDKNPISWQEDSIPLLLRKSSRKLMAVRPLTSLLTWATPAVERVAPKPVLRRWYYGILGSYMLIGYQDGMAAAGTIER